MMTNTIKNRNHNTPKNEPESFLPGLTKISNTQGRQEIDFDFDWRFLLEAKDCSVKADTIHYDDRGWEPVQLPHDFSILQPFDKDAPAGGSGGHMLGGVGWYRKWFLVEPEFSGKRAYIEFDGVYRNSDVWCNGMHLGHRHYGYASFRYELTMHLKPGEMNLIAVRADNSDQPNCRWYSGSGIYRHVRLVITDEVAIAPWGMYVTTENALSKVADVHIRTTIDNSKVQENKVRLITTIFDPKGESITADTIEVTVPSKDGKEIDKTLHVESPQLWSPESPFLYTAVSKVERLDGEVIDEVTTRFGIREIEFNAGRGFLLNGKVTKLKGGNIHHDGGCVGAAVPKAVWRRRFETLKAIGANTIRTSHNPPAPEVLDLCDEMGLMVYDEAFDKWSEPFEPVPWLHSTHAAFEDDWQKDLDAMVLRDRNHPSIVIWSVGNEVVEYGKGKSLPIYRKLANRVRQLNPTRPVTQALVFSPQRQEHLHESGLAREMDIISLNYQEVYYEDDRRQHPDRLIIGSETKPFFTTGRKSKLAHFVPNRNPWQDVIDNDYVIGGLLWPVIDYFGEANWPRNGWCAGPIDTCGWPKARCNYFQCAWLDTPQVRIQIRDDSLPIIPGKLSWDAPRMICHWNWPQKKDNIVFVQTPTNCQTVELLLNGMSAGIRNTADFPQNTIDWYVPYEPGRLEAIGRNDGKEVARWHLETTSSAVSLEIVVDRQQLAGDGHDIAHVEIRVVDEMGRLVPDHDVYVNVNVTGCGTFLGMDNGDQVSKEPYFIPRRKTYFGRCLAIVRARRGCGKINVRAISEELSAAETQLTVGE